MILQMRSARPFLSHSFVNFLAITVSIVYTVGVPPLLNKELRQNLYEYKKGVDRCIYQSGAIDCLNAINTNDPRPKRAVALGHTTNNRLTSRYSKPRYVERRHTCVSVRLVLAFGNCRYFALRTRAKTLLLLKNKIKKVKRSKSLQKRALL